MWNVGALQCLGSLQQHDLGRLAVCREPKGLASVARRIANVAGWYSRLVQMCDTTQIHKEYDKDMSLLVTGGIGGWGAKKSVRGQRKRVVYQASECATKVGARGFKQITMPNTRQKREEKKTCQTNLQQIPKMPKVSKRKIPSYSSQANSCWGHAGTIVYSGLVQHVHSDARLPGERCHCTARPEGTLWL